jgi:hypothetical protein
MYCFLLLYFCSFGVLFELLSLIQKSLLAGTTGIFWEKRISNLSSE